MRKRMLYLLLCLIGGIHASAANLPADIPEDLTQFDNSAYTRILSRFVDSQGQVDYAALKADRDDLDRYVASFGKLEPMTFNAWNGAAKMAFWLNAYNAVTLRIITNHYPIKKTSEGKAYPASSIRQISGVWDEIRTTIMEKPMTLDEIEHDMLRKQFADPRIHMALVCGTRGSPPLLNEPYNAKRLDDQLTSQTSRFLSDSSKLVVVPETQQLRVSPIFHWFAKDFIPAYESQVSPTANTEGPAAIFWFISQNSDSVRRLEARKWNLVLLPYDWRLNESAHVD